MDVSPQDIRAMKESLRTIEGLGVQITKLIEERENEINLLDRRLSFVSHPAGKGRKDVAPLNHINTSDNVVDILSKKEN